MSKSKSAYIVIVHGSREAEANRAFEAFLKKLAAKAKSRKIYGAFLELCKPSIPEALEAALSAGAREIFILPMMFFPGRHVKQDIPRFVQEAKAKYPDAYFHFASPLADHPLMVKLLADKAKKVKNK